MDPRLKYLSYSSILKLHSCPRNYELYKRNSKEEDTDTDGFSNITFAFGHIVGEGIQYVLEGRSENETIFKMFMGWHADLEARNEKQVKSIYHAIAAVQKFIAMRELGLLRDYELVYYQGKPATELSFKIKVKK